MNKSQPTRFIPFMLTTVFTSLVITQIFMYVWSILHTIMCNKTSRYCSRSQFNKMRKCLQKNINLLSTFFSLLQTITPTFLAYKSQRIYENLGENFTNIVETIYSVIQSSFFVSCFKKFDVYGVGTLGKLINLRNILIHTFYSQIILD